MNRTDAVNLALENEQRRRGELQSLRERPRPLQDRVAATPETGQAADREFYDALSGYELELDP
jgi:antitoxin VapB